MKKVKEVIGLLDDILSEFGSKPQILLSVERLIEMRDMLSGFEPNKFIDLECTEENEYVMCLKCQMTFLPEELNDEGVCQKCFDNKAVTYVWKQNKHIRIVVNGTPEYAEAHVADLVDISDWSIE